MVRGNKKGFTLIELLIVVSIIMILAGMLLPALNTVKKKVKSIQCENNLRQCGFAVHQYADDYGDYFPFAAPPGSSSWRTFHLAAIINYLQISKSSVMAKNGPLVCPSHVVLTTVDIPEMRLWYNPSSANLFYYGYGGNSFVFSADPYTILNGTPSIPVKRSRIRDSSQTLMMADASATTLLRYTQRFYVCHQRGFNSSWLDGHVNHIKTPFPDGTDISVLAAPFYYFYQTTDTSLPPWGYPY